MILAAFLSAAFMIGGISAYYLLRGRFVHKAQFCMKAAILFAAITAPLQIVVGDSNGQEVHRDQPAKLAAIEAHWDKTENGVPLVLFAIPNEAAERNDYALQAPHLGSLVLTHSLDGNIPSLKGFAVDERPPVAIVFYAFRIMVGLGVLMVLLPWWGLWNWRRGHLQASRGYGRCWIRMMPSGFVALLADWWVAEVGRPPWVVSSWLPFLAPRLMARRFVWPHFSALTPVSVLALLNAGALWLTTVRRHELASFILALCFFLLGFVGLIIGLWPNITPPSMGIWDTASPVQSQRFVLEGAVIMLPVVLAYTAYSYRVFRGKLTAETAYY